MANLRALRKRLREIERKRGPRGTVRLGSDVDVSAIYGDQEFEPDRHWKRIQHDEWVALYRHRKTGAKRARYERRVTDQQLVARGGDLAFL